ncbi:MAG: PilZ domain-containing protein [Candidatus Omnitrophica bacterium]|nr:PilZ domain-containing protein [Candidatus Omnitrophota bacterium]
MKRERRKFKRIDTEKVEVMWRKDDSFDNLNKMRNVSEGGFRLVIGDEQINPGEVIQVEFKLPTGEIIHSKAKVVWIKSFKAKDEQGKATLEAGIEFTDITSKDRQTIKSFVK